MIRKGEKRNAVFWFGKQKAGDRVEYTGIDGRIILK
jgi:hypothetical protein